MDSCLFVGIDLTRYLEVVLFAYKLILLIDINLQICKEHRLYLNATKTLIRYMDNTYCYCYHNII